MKKVNLFFNKSLLVAFACFSIMACEEGSERISSYDMYPVTTYEKETENTSIARTSMSHYNRNVNEYKLYEGDVLLCTGNVSYRSDGIVCTLNGIRYHIELDNVLGGSRAKKITATDMSGALFYETEYFYDKITERLEGANINALGGPYYTRYTYHDSYIIIHDSGFDELKIELSNEENTGYACNVLGYEETSLTSKYVINPDLYFLNIYGKPVDKLPQGCDIVRSEKTMRVGKFFYEYRD